MSMNEALKRIIVQQLQLGVILCCLYFHGICQSSQGTVIDDTSIVHLADPTIFNHQQTFFLYGTVEGNAGNGFLVYESKDLRKWRLSGKDEGYAFRKGDGFGTTGFWAPQIFFHKEKFYMAYVANENIAIAESDN